MSPTTERLQEGLRLHEDPATMVMLGAPRRGAWVGRLVKLNRQVVTRGGKVIATGTVMKVTACRGNLELIKVDVCPHCQCGDVYRVRGINPVSVTVLPDAPAQA